MTLIMPISVRYRSELRPAMTSSLGVQFLLMKVQYRSTIAGVDIK